MKTSTNALIYSSKPDINYEVENSFSISCLLENRYVDGEDSDIDGISYVFHYNSRNKENLDLDDEWWKFCLERLCDSSPLKSDKNVDMKSLV